MINENKKECKKKIIEITKELGVNLDKLNNKQANSWKKLKMDVDLANKFGLEEPHFLWVGNEIIFGYIPVDDLNKIN